MHRGDAVPLPQDSEGDPAAEPRAAQEESGRLQGRRRGPGQDRGRCESPHAPRRQRPEAPPGRLQLGVHRLVGGARGKRPQVLRWHCVGPQRVAGRRHGRVGGLLPRGGPRPRRRGLREPPGPRRDPQWRQQDRRGRRRRRGHQRRPPRHTRGCLADLLHCEHLHEGYVLRQGAQCSMPRGRHRQQRGTGEVRVQRRERAQGRGGHRPDHRAAHPASGEGLVLQVPARPLRRSDMA
mmetsp:Transcript_19041/g.50295  ORF Transcript_19041/g.50295 Transcript_19041/m.50295 type:complete len:236 (+) Transcript_19041:144-851(+)